VIRKGVCDADNYFLAPPTPFMEEAVLGGGCFWCIEGAFKDLRGVIEALPGYSGGEGPADYESVCSGTTGHAEVVKVTFNPEVISFREILRVFFTVHNPTQLNRQGNDIGTQYRSVIFTNNERQNEIISEVISELQPYYETPIVTQLEKLDKIHIAEEYHHNYFARNPQNNYCQLVVGPKLAKLRNTLSDLYQ